MNISFTGKNAIICGSTHGIGKAAALEFANQGANVTLIARSESLLKKTHAELHNNGKQKHEYIAVDFNFPDKLKDKIKKYVKSHTAVHILVNNSGGPKPGDILTADIKEFTSAFSAHLVCNHILVQALVPGMKKEKYGRIINIISTSVKQPIKGLGVSNTIRWAVAAWAKTLASELAHFGITVNNILPGATKTERLYSLFESRAKSAGKSIDVIEKEWLKEIPAGRFAEPHELANAIAFLASPAASYINGINLPVDGGRLNSL